MLAIMTGTISPSEKMGQLKLSNTGERLEQYLDSLMFLVDSQAFDKIVFCENSNFGTEKFVHIQKAAGMRGVALELLSYQGDTAKILHHGKGYGEGESVAHALQNSSLAGQEPYMVKITGRLRVENIRRIAGRIDRQKTYFNIPNRTRREIYDTRIYAMPTAQFKQFFAKAYKEVRDAQGVYLEHIYTETLLRHRINVYNFPCYPRITGFSGSSGIAYGYTEWKCRVKDALSRFNVYTVKKRGKGSHTG